MRIQVNDRDGNTRTITSRNPVLIGAWFAEIAPDCMDRNPAMMKDIKLYITPENNEEWKLTAGHQQTPFTAEGLISLYLAIKKVAEEMLKSEIENGQTA